MQPTTPTDLSINNYFEKQLVDNNYKIHSDNWNNAIRIFQKRITDEFGIRYFITISHYNHGKQIPHSGAEDQDSYVFKVQFRYDKDNKDYTIDISFSGDFIHNKWRKITTLEDAEEHFNKIWKFMKYDYYEKD